MTSALPLPRTLDEAREVLASHRFGELDGNVTADHADRLAEALRIALANTQHPQEKGETTHA